MLNEIKVSLNARPSLVKTGICEHGHVPHEHHVTTEWVLHYYNFACQFELGSESYSILPGTLALFPPNATVHWTFPHENCLIQYAHFVAPVTEEQTVLPMLQLDAVGERGWSNSLTKVSKCFSAQPLRAEVVLWDLLFDLAECHTEEHETRIDFHKAPIDIAQTIIRSELSQKLTVTDLCRRAGASASCLNRQSHERFGMSLKDYLQQQRAERGLALLMDTDLPIRAVAQNVGFGTLQQFNRFMHKFYDRSPRDIRKMDD